MGWLNAFHFTELDLQSLQIDSAGGIFYADAFELDSGQVSPVEPTVALAAVPVSPFPQNLVFHSRPGAPNVLFLDFDGEDVTSTQWNTDLSRSVIPALAFSTDSDYSTFSDSEQLAIKRIWQRMAEDYAPFNVDVTTERPATFTTRTGHALITRNTDANGASNPASSAGGVAYVNVFGSSSYSRYRPAWIYCNNLGGSESYIAEAASHELGHNLGLSHDGTTSLEYYGGHGSGDISWGPLMGTGYNREVSQWSKGEYYLANNTEDDLAIISGKLTYVPDDHGNTLASATALTVTDGTNILATTPETDPTNSNTHNKGVIERNTDVDVFSFTSGSGPVNLTLKPWVSPVNTSGGNLDLSVELLNEAGVVLLTNNPPTATSAIVQTNLTEGIYYLRVRNSGAGSPMVSPPSGYTSYASLGQYFINGTVTRSGFVVPPQALLQVANLLSPSVGAAEVTVTYSDDVAVDVGTLSSANLRVTGPWGYDRPAEFVSVDQPFNGSPRVATYAIDPPNGTDWTIGDNGTYTIYMESNQVADTEGAWVRAGQLGQFEVSIAIPIYTADFNSDPGWTLDSLWQYGQPAYGGTGPVAGVTGPYIVGYNLAGEYANRLSTCYATTPAIDCSKASELRLRFYRWLGLRQGDTALIQISTNGVAWADLWSAPGAVSDGGWILCEYALPSWANYSPALHVRWALASDNAKADIGWNLDDVQVVASGLQVSPPSVQLNLSSAPAGWGTVSPAGGQYPTGSTIELRATPAPYFSFREWSGAFVSSENPISVLLESNLTLVANFEEILTTNHPTPYWWLASNGYTNNFETVVTNLTANGYPLWQSYIAGLQPNDATSQLLIGITPTDEGSILAWPTVAGRVYTILQSTNLAGSFVPVPGAANLPASLNSITNQVVEGPWARFYRVQVDKP